MEDNLINIRIEPSGATYTFNINGYKITFQIGPRENNGHPLDILQADLASLVRAISHLERFDLSQVNSKKPLTLSDFLQHAEIKKDDEPAG